MRKPKGKIRNTLIPVEEQPCKLRKIGETRKIGDNT